MKGVKMGSSCREIVIRATCYLCGIAMVAIFSCEGDVLYDRAYAESPIGDSQELATAAFEFEEGFEDIVSMQASAYIEFSDENPLKDYRLYVTGELLVVEVDTLRGKTVHFDFSFYDDQGNEVRKFRPQADINRNLINYRDNEFGDNLKVVYHTQPLEAEIEQHDSISVPLEPQKNLWYHGQSYTVRQLVKVRSDSEVSSPDSTIQKFNNAVGVMSDAGPGEIVHLESIPTE